jgi:hypothetical protein
LWWDKKKHKFNVVGVAEQLAADALFLQNYE